MVIIFRPNIFLILINISSNISQILGKIFCRHSTNVLCLLDIDLLCITGKPPLIRMDVDPKFLSG